VTDLFPPYGGYPKFVQEGLNEDWLPVWLQNAGYNTYYVGKLFNAHDVDNYDSPYVNGFNGSDFLLDPYTYQYYNGHMTRNGESPVSYAGLYSPDVVAQKAYDLLDEAALHPEPFFLSVAPVAPHSNVKLAGGIEMGTALYAERHAHLFKDYKIPRTANFNPKVPSGVGWVRDLPLLNDTVIEYHDEFQRSRLRALQSVDEMVEHLIKQLEEKGILDNTFIFYTTDNVSPSTGPSRSSIVH
jgi:N-acetylglucosamine-6-sulfatase